MNIENNIFKRLRVDYKKLKDYGFKLDNDIYKYSKYFLNNTFRADVMVCDGVVSGKVFDLEAEEEYINFRVEEQTGEFVNTIREEYKMILKDIAINCFINVYFVCDQSNRIAVRIIKNYKDYPEFIFDTNPGFGVFRNSFTKKWYAMIMNLDFSKFENKTGEIEVLNIKLDSKKIEKLLTENGFYKAYHMNKNSWISIILNDTIKDDMIMKYIDESYNYSLCGKLNRIKGEWIIPANPKYYDIEAAFRESDAILWKQGSGIKTSDIVYIYQASPISSIRYKCVVVDDNIPYESNCDIKMKYAMKIKLLKTYPIEKYSLNFIKTYGVTTVRGPRYMPKDLSVEINKQ